MLGKCANPNCSAQFRYFHDGRLFVIETGRSRPLQYYWLCASCSLEMTVEYDGIKGSIAKRAVPVRTSGAKEYWTHILQKAG